MERALDFASTEALAEINSVQINQLLANVQGYLGFFDNHRLPPFEKGKQQSAILSIRPVPIGVKQFDGKHWVALFYSPAMGANYFDSYGVPPSQEVLGLMKRMSPKCYYNTSWVQPKNSVGCGYYAVGFIKHLSEGKSAESFVYSFDFNLPTSNDDVARRFATE